MKIDKDIFKALGITAVILLVLAVVVLGKSAFEKDPVDCFNQAYVNYTISWNRECSKLNLENNCTLPSDVADAIDDMADKAYDECDL